MNSAESSDLSQRRLPDNSATESAINAPNVPALLDEDASGLIIPDSPAMLLGLEMADARTTPPDAPPLESVVCPFCAHVRTEGTGSCPKCTMEDTPTTRRSTGERIGPWFVLQRKNPTAPGLRLSVLLTLARRGHVTARSIVRGPTTGQFWRYAGQVKGLSRVFGVCWHCGASVSPDAATCPRCRSAQEIPDDPDQFLESHAALPVMREVPRDTEENEPRALPGLRRDLPEPRAPKHELTPADPRVPADSRAPAGTRSITLARGEDDVILSASELAAAFQLDLPTPGLVKRTSRRLWKVTKAAALLVLVLAAGVVALVYFRPDWYQLARDESRPYWEKTQSWVARVTGRPQRRPSALEDLSQLPPITPIQLEPTAGTSRSNPGAATETNRSAETGLDMPVGPHPRIQSVWSAGAAVDADAPIDALAGQTSVFLPSTRKTTVTPSQPVEALPELVETLITKKVADAAGANAGVSSQPPEPSIKQPVGETGPAPMSLEEAIANAAHLRTSALDAEARRDWQAAVLIYEQIAKLPEGAHPSDLKVKLAVARERARS